MHRVLSVCNACMNHKVTFAAHGDLRETFSKTLRYRVTNVSLQQLSHIRATAVYIIHVHHRRCAERWCAERWCAERWCAER